MKCSALVTGVSQFEEIKKGLIQNLSSEALYGDIGAALSESIMRRTFSGTDVEGEPFRDYSKKYAKLRAGKGRSEKPDLRMTGQMLDDIVVHANGPGMTARITFDSSESMEKACYNDTGETRRHFFGIDGAQAQEIETEILKKIDAVLNAY